MTPSFTNFSFYYNLIIVSRFWQLGECWAGNSNQHNYKKHGADMKGCIQDDHEECDKGTRFCTGKKWRNMVYRIGKFYHISL